MEKYANRMDRIWWLATDGDQDEHRICANSAAEMLDFEKS